MTVHRMPAIPDRFRKGKSRPGGARNQPAVGTTRKINMSENQITITVTMDEATATQLAQFAKRSTLDTFVSFVEPHLKQEQREERAYQMQAGVMAVGQALAAAGFAPR